MAVSEMKPKWLPICELLRILCTNAVYEITSCTCALWLIKCHPTRHYLHHIIRLFHTKYFKQNIIFRTCLYNSNITNLFILNVSINKDTRNCFWPVMPLIDQISLINSFGFEICNKFGDTRFLHPTIPGGIFSVSYIRPYILTITVDMFLFDFYDHSPQ